MPPVTRIAPATLDRGTTVRIEAQVRDYANALATPATITAEILSPTGTSFSGPSGMTVSSTGVYLLDVQTSESGPTGMYQIVIRVTSGGFITLLKENGFMLE